eukprot:10641-Heterococcus_DN1.PRE.1
MHKGITSICKGLPRKSHHVRPLSHLIRSRCYIAARYKDALCTALRLQQSGMSVVQLYASSSQRRWQSIRPPFSRGGHTATSATAYQQGHVIYSCYVESMYAVRTNQQRLSTKRVPSRFKW